MGASANARYIWTRLIEIDASLFEGSPELIANIAKHDIRLHIGNKLSGCVHRASIELLTLARDSMF